MLRLLALLMMRCHYGCLHIIADFQSWSHMLRHAFSPLDTPPPPLRLIVDGAVIGTRYKTHKNEYARHITRVYGALR